MSTQFGIDLRVARRKSGLTQTDVAHLIESHQSSVAALENGNAEPTVEQMCLFWLIFGRTFEGAYDDLLERGRKRLRRNLPSLPASPETSFMSRNRESSLQKLEVRLREAQSPHDAA